MARFQLATVVCAVVLASCGGKVESQDDPVINDTQGGLAAPDPSGGGGGDSNAGDDDDSKADEGCKDGDRDGHKHHHKHWFRHLDKLDGTQDKQITIANLPDGLPDGLIKRLHQLDANNDGVVTKKEARHQWKAWAHRHHDHDDDGDD